MPISTEKEQISLTVVENVAGSFESSLMKSNPDYFSRLPLESELMVPAQLPNLFTDVNVVSEHENNELQQSILNLEGEIEQLRQKERLLDKKRRGALNKILDIKGSIRVFCRVRPFPLTDRRLREPLSLGLEKVVVRSAGCRKEYQFDKIFHEDAPQEEVFAEVEPILRSALDGYNVCILAYGQTGTGKTFAMDGTIDQPGIIPRALEELFHQRSFENSSVTFSMSMLEVYMGHLRDLLAPKVATRSYEAFARSNLNIQTDPKGFVEIEGLTEVPIADYAKAKWWYAKGRRARATSWTNVNETSSSLTRIIISRHRDDLKGKTEVSKLWMVDLGGSERLLKTGATGQTLDEGKAINLSLSALGDVIAALRRKRVHVPYRQVLAWKYLITLNDLSIFLAVMELVLICLCPCEEDVGETICSLTFATRARAVETNRELSEDIMKLRQKRILELEDDMREAEEECQKVRNQVQKAQFLLTEYRKLFSKSDQSTEDKENAPTTPELTKVVTKTPPIADKGVKRNMTSSFPRFMTSTVASRQRQSSAERELIGRARGSKSVTRSSLQFSASQSISYSDIRLKAMIRESNKKSRYGDTKQTHIESPKCNGSDLKAAASLPRSKLVNSSDPNLRTTLNRHRRRMSDLI
ncbi:hypothetical protein Tsubulata_042433 [Turnera subulata]|uniref:Kinesin motor domain-containing protein n=1 Tax=Turnera subulata TaxID=218843 RepID=A0A9Q0G332_9ROSI|nr:hypothetical protein Tsubulata_042433 [Turnera subulata]